MDILPAPDGDSASPGHLPEPSVAIVSKYVHKLPHTAKHFFSTYLGLLTYAIQEPDQRTRKRLYQLFRTYTQGRLCLPQVPSAPSFIGDVRFEVPCLSDVWLQGIIEGVKNVCLQIDEIITQQDRAAE